jgi:integrase
MKSIDLKDAPPGKLYFLDKGIYARKTLKGEIQYGISYTYQGRQVRHIVGPSLTKAREALAIRKAEISQDRYEIPRKRKHKTFDQLADIYMEHAKQAKRSWKRDEGTLKHARAFFSPKRLDEITTWDIERFRVARAETVTKATVNRDTALLKRMFRLAIEWDLMLENPAGPVRLYQEPEHAMRVLSLDEERKLYREAAPHLKPIINVALNTGLRRGELLALEWPDIMLDKKMLIVKQSKSGKIRNIPLNDMAYESIRTLPEVDKKGYIFLFRGRPISSIRRAFERAVARAKIPAIRFHDLRHTFATRLVLGGTDLATLKELMGHANIQTTMRYTHPTPESKRFAVDSLLVSVYGYKLEKPPLKLIRK